MGTFWNAFLPLFVAFDGIGLVPVFWTMAKGLGPAKRVRAISEATATALGVSLGFLVASRSIFALMGLGLADIMMAGGGILIVLCLRELVMPERRPGREYDSPGVVPLGVPLLAGPAVLTTVLLVRDQYGWPVTLAALVANMAVVWAVLRSSSWSMRWLGPEGAQVISKIFNVILTAFGVMLIRRGIATVLAGHLAG